MWMHSPVDIQYIYYNIHIYIDIYVYIYIYIYRLITDLPSPFKLNSFSLASASLCGRSNKPAYILWSIIIYFNFKLRHSHWVNYLWVLAVFTTIKSIPHNKTAKAHRYVTQCPWFQGSLYIFDYLTILIWNSFYIIC